MPNLTPIPEARRDPVRAAMRAAFGAGRATRLGPLRGGVSGALIIRFQMRGRAYVLRVEPERIPLRDRQRGFACMAAAARTGAAPQVHFADPETGVAIMEFVFARPLSAFPGGPPALARSLGALIARVQATPTFPALTDYPDAIEAMLAGLAGSPHLTPGEAKPLAEGLARLRAALPWAPSSAVSSHNDPNPRNLLFDGERLWLIDWELAFRNDPLVDVAILTTEIVEGPELEDILLRAAFGAPPSRAVRARLSLVRLLTRLFYGCIVLEGFDAPPRSGPALAAHTPEDFRAAVAEGRLVSGAQETAYAFARMSLAAFLKGVAAPSFKQSAAILAQA